MNASFLTHFVLNFIELGDAKMTEMMIEMGRMSVYLQQVYNYCNQTMRIPGSVGQQSHNILGISVSASRGR